MPSLIESYGNAVAEAVAAGFPVLLTDTCGIAPAIHERARLAVSLGVEKLAHGLRTLLDPAESPLDQPPEGSDGAALLGRTAAADG